MQLMNIKTQTFLQFIEETTKQAQSCVMVVRTIGPDACTDADKVNEIYSAYKTNMDEENVDVFPTFLANEWSFLTFETEDLAIEYAKDNLPKTNDVDPDYFVQCWVFYNGFLSYANDNLTTLSHSVVATPSQ